MLYTLLGMNDAMVNRRTTAWQLIAFLWQKTHGSFSQLSISFLLSAGSAFFSSVSLILLFLLANVSTLSSSGAASDKSSALIKFLSSSGSGTSLIPQIIFALFFAQVTRVVFQLLEEAYAGHVSALLSHRISMEIFERYLSLGKAFFDKSNYAQLQTIISFPREIKRVYSGVQVFCSNFLLLLSRLAILAWMSPKLTAAAFMIFLPLYFFTKATLKRLESFSMARKHLVLDISKDFFNVFKNASFSKLNVDKSLLRDRHSSLRSRLRLLDEKSSFYLTIAKQGPQLLILAVIGFLFASLRLPTEHFASDIAAYAVFFYVIKTCVPLFTVLTQIVGSWVDVIGEASSLRELFDPSLDRYVIPDGEVEYASFERELEFRSVDFAYEEGKTALKDVSFVCRKGEFIALAGANGSGKSTCISLLLRLYDVTGGFVLADGTDIRKFRIGSLHEQFSYFSQDIPLFHDSIIGNILFGVRREVSRDEILSIMRDLGMDAFIESLPEGLDTVVGDDGVLLSGGQKQLLSVVRGLLRGAPIFLLDETTSSVDPHTEELIHQVIAARAPSATKIMVTHRLGVLRETSRIIVLDEGRVVESGTFDDLVSAGGVFARLYETWNAQAHQSA